MIGRVVSIHSKAPTIVTRCISYSFIARAEGKSEEVDEDAWEESRILGDGTEITSTVASLLPPTLTSRRSNREILFCTIYPCDDRLLVSSVRVAFSTEAKSYFERSGGWLWIIDFRLFRYLILH
jgi:hypothetical protein